MKEDILNEESKITPRLRKLSIDCIRKLSTLKTNLIGIYNNKYNTLHLFLQCYHWILITLLKIENWARS